MTSRPPPGEGDVPAALAAARIPGAVVDLVRNLKAAGFAAYVVGGGLRDLVRGRTVDEVKDWDVATGARPADVQALFRRVVPTGIAHGTVTVLTGALPVEVTTFRGEGAYADGRHPSEVRFLDDVRDDLARRDFTINAMAFDPIDGVFVDPFGGRADLDAGLVRCVGDPHARFGEDGLRAMRAVRFASTLGFRLDPPTEAAIPGTLATFRKVAAERVREEFTRMLVGRTPSRGLDLMAKSGLLAEVLPEIGDPRVARRLALLPHLFASADAAPADAAVRLAALLHAAGSDTCGAGSCAAAVAEDVLDRLRYPRKVIDAAALLVRELPAFEAAPEDDGAIRRLLSRVGLDGIGPLLDLARAHARARGPSAAPSVEILERQGRRVDVLRAQRPPLAATDLALRGDDVVAALGGKPGARVGRAIRHLLDRVLEDPALNTREQLSALLAEWARSDAE